MIEHRFTAKTLTFDFLKEDIDPTSLVGIEYNGKKVNEEKSEMIWKQIRNSSKVTGTSFIFIDQVNTVLNTMSDSDKLKRAKVIAEEMSDYMNFCGDYTIKDYKGNLATNERLQRVVELEKELRSLGY